MAFSPDGQRRLYSQSPSSVPSTASLLPPSARGPQTVQAAFSRGPPSLRSMASSASLNDTPYTVSAPGGRVPSQIHSISDKFSLSPDPSSWGADLSLNYVEPDDDLHNPDPRRDRKNDRGGTVFTARGLMNLGCLLILAVGLTTLFAGYPLISYFTKSSASNNGGFNVYGLNSSGMASWQVPEMIGNFGLIDQDTPASAQKIPSFMDSSTNMQLVFSDEFNTDGRTFWPGDDPYWEAVNLHYWETNDLEWYYPDAITTANGSLQITMSQQSINGLNYKSGMMSTWNKFCFTGGIILANVSLPGMSNVVGFWPALWTMGNLGRVGYGATLDGLWPYSYDTCDVGTVANQTKDGQPEAALTNGDPYNGDVLSYLPGQRLSRCTCPGQSHPGPVHSDGTYVGRASPEIDILEAQITGSPLSGQVSQSAQWAPMDAGYEWQNTSQNLIIPNPSVTELNTYTGGVYQQSTSGVTITDQSCYTGEDGCFAVYGFEYLPGFDDAYITWIANDQVAWTLMGAGVGNDTATEIGPRAVSQEPMYIIVNFGMSYNFAAPDFAELIFPAVFSIDWIRVYQDESSTNIGCDPPDFPTAAYINEYIDAYSNPNYTTWNGDYGQPWPLNSWIDQCPET